MVIGINLLKIMKKLNVTESNSSVTVRLFTYAQDPAYDEAANKPAWIGYKKEVIIMTFGEKLKEARKEAGLSQEQFAEKMNVSRSAIAKWESDKGMPGSTAWHQFGLPFR